MLEYIIICIGLVLILFMWLIYKKIDQKKSNGDEIKFVRESTSRQHKFKP